MFEDEDDGADEGEDPTNEEADHPTSDSGLIGTFAGS